MKRQHLVGILTCIALSLGILVSWFAFTGSFSEVQGNAPTTVIEIERDSVHLDTVNYDEGEEVYFKLKNTGTHPLLVKDIITSCGCTTPEWDKRPVPPGKEKEIHIRFKPNSLGRFVKEIKVICNTSTGVHSLKIDGYVIE